MTTMLGKAFAQIQSPQTPHPQTYQPVQSGQNRVQQYQPKINNTSPHAYGAALQTRTADQLAYQQQVKSMPDAIYKRVHETNKALTMTSNVPFKNRSSVDVVQDILKDVRTRERSMDYKLPSLMGNVGGQNFKEAYSELVQMLEGKKPMSLKRAVFLSENAFLNNEMDYADFERKISEMAMLIQLKMKQEGMPLDNNDAINYMAHQYMSDTLTIELPATENTVTTFPKRYDFDDPFGYDKPTNLFVTKVMLENTGQCKSLPLLYLLLVEELGGKAYLSLSPSHTFIKCKASNGSWYNVELTNGMLTSDSWVIGSGYVKAEAVKSGLFLDTMGTRDVIANCLVDLGQYYSYRYNGHDDFVLACTNKALEYHKTNVTAMQVKSDYYSLLFKYVSEQKGYSSVDDLKNDRKAMELFIQRNRMYALLDGLGFESMPESAYTEWLETLNEKQQQQEHEKQFGSFSKMTR